MNELKIYFSPNGKVFGFADYKDLPEVKLKVKEGDMLLYWDYKYELGFVLGHIKIKATKKGLQLRGTLCEEGKRLIWQNALKGSVPLTWGISIELSESGHLVTSASVFYSKNLNLASA